MRIITMDTWPWPPPPLALLRCRSKEAAIAFGKVPVLQEHVRELQIHNMSAIPAEFKLFVEARDSSFAVEPREAVLQPGESLAAQVLVMLDEALPFRDTLHVLVTEGADHCIPLEATGEP
jgi:hydrocephalus-inducing protein